MPRLLSSRSFSRAGSAALLSLVLGACASTPDAGKAAAKAIGGRAASASPLAPVGDLRAGRPVTGALARGDSILQEDSSFVDAWRYAGRAGERVTVTMSSKSFDTFLSIHMGGQVIATNDDVRGGSGTNSRLTLELPVTGVYTVNANSVRRGETGMYSLALTTQATAATAATAATDWARTYPGGGDPAERYAVLVGIDKYPESLHGNLDGPAADARVMRQLLLGKYGFRPENVLLVTDREATRDRILQAAERHLGQAGAEGVAVFYYSGHGTQLDGDFGTLAPTDREPDGRDEALLVWGSEHGSLILDDELGALSDRLRAGRALFILDACHSGSGGAARPAAEGDDKQVDVASARPSVSASDWLGVMEGGSAAAARRRVLLTASSEDELSWTAARPWEGGGKESVFTHYLVQQLRNAGPAESFSRVIGRVHMATTRYTKAEHGKPQTPQMEGARLDESVWEFLRKR
jgi:hypothetical protein